MRALHKNRSPAPNLGEILSNCLSRHLRLRILVSSSRFVSHLVLCVEVCAAMGNMSRFFIRELGGHNRLRPRLCALSRRSVTTVAQDAGVQKTGRRGGVAGVVAVLAGVSLVGGSYYAMKLQPQPRPLPPATVQNLPPPANETQPPSPFATPGVSARDELVQRMESLKSELQALRKQKRDKLIDMKKKAIKEDIQTIQSALASFDKQS